MNTRRLSAKALEETLGVSFKRAVILSCDEDPDKKYL